jgi:hypothetical protein
MSAPPFDRVIGVRGTATPDELAAVLAALARRPAPMGDRYEQWRRSRIAVIARGRLADKPAPRPCQVRRPQPPRLSTDPAGTVRR